MKRDKPGPEVYLKVASTFIAAALLLVALTINLQSTPPLWWDEGWTLSVARNWAEQGHYGRLLDGHPTPRGLEAAFPVTATVALSFAVFGVGILQGRLVAVLFTLAALALLYALARRFYSRSIANATLLVVIFMSGQVEINPLIVGRQVLAEIPALVFLLAGYLCFLRAEKRRHLLSVAICLWSIALFAKVQLQPFWAVSLFFGLVFAAIQRQWQSAKMFGAGFVGSLALLFCLQYLFSHAVRSAGTSGLTRVIALVVLPHTRLIVLAETLLYGLPILAGLGWALWFFFKNHHRFQNHADIVRCSYLALVGSWFVWFEILSLGWPRYLFPSVFLGSVFVAALLEDWTNHFNFAYTIEQAGTVLTKLRFRKQTLRALAAVLLIVMSLGQTLTVLYEAYAVESDRSIKDALRFLNTATPRNALIETYETELFFLLRRRYHYPPDQVHVDLIRRNSLGERVKIDYDPLAADPDYLVVGRQSKFWDFYDPYLISGNFRLVIKYPGYEIYERVR